MDCLCQYGDLKHKYLDDVNLAQTGIMTMLGTNVESFGTPKRSYRPYEPTNRVQNVYPTPEQDYYNTRYTPIQSDRR